MEKEITRRTKQEILEEILGVEPDMLTVTDENDNGDPQIDPVILAEILLDIRDDVEEIKNTMIKLERGQRI